MKRSSKISLVLLASTSLLAIAACDEDEKKTEVQIETYNQCKEYFDNRQCNVLFDSDNPRPIYASKEDCVEALQDSTQCVELNRHSDVPITQNANNSGGSNWFMPAFTGFMIGRMLSNGSPQYQYAPYPQNLKPNEYENYRKETEKKTGGSSYVYTPVNTTSSAWGRTSSTPMITSTTTAKGTSVSVGRASSASAATSARGGFGSAASAHASSSGS